MNCMHVYVCECVQLICRYYNKLFHSSKWMYHDDCALRMF